MEYGKNLFEGHCVCYKKVATNCTYLPVRVRFTRVIAFSSRKVLRFVAKFVIERVRMMMMNVDCEQKSLKFDGVFLFSDRRV